MPPGKQAKEVKIEFKMEVNKMVSAMKDVQKSFQESTQNIDKMSDSFKNMETKLHLVNMKMADMTKNISAMTKTNMIMSKDIKESFATWGTLLNDNNQKITSTINKMIQLNKQNQAQREELAKQKAFSQGTDRGIDATFFRLKMLNMGFNLVRSSAKSAISEIMELESAVKTISTITGEATGFIESNIKRLSIQSGISMDKIGKALQDAANEGNTLTASMEKINAAMLISQKSGISFENAIARVDDISDQFGKSADYVSASMLHLNLSSERAMKVFGRLARDVKEANISFEDAGAMMSILANKAGVSESSLQISMRAMLNGIQRLGKEGSAEFMNNILPRWNSLSDAQKRIIEQRLGLDKNSMVLDEIGKRYGEIHQRALEVVRDQDKILEQSKKNPETAIKKMNEAWIHFISILKDAIMTIDNLIPRFATITAFANAIAKVAEHVKNIRNTQVESQIRDKDTQIADFESSIANVEALRAKTVMGSQAWNDYGNAIDGARLQIKRVQKERSALIQSISEGDAPIAASAGLMKSVVSSGKNNLGGRKSVLWGGMLDAPGINLDVLKSEKTSDKDEIQSFKNSLVSINTNFNIEREHYGKLAALQRKKIELEKLYQDTTVHTNKMAQDHGTESETYTKKMKSILGEIGLALAKTRADIAGMVGASSESAQKQAKKNHSEEMARLKDEYDAKHANIMSARENGNINALQQVAQLKELDQYLIKQKNSVELIAKAERERFHILTQQNAQMAKTENFIQTHGNKMSREIRKQELDASKERVRSNAKNKSLTEEQHYQFKLKELELQKQFALEDSKFNDKQMTQLDAINQYKQRTNQLTIDLRQASAAGNQQKITEIQNELTAEDMLFKNRIDAIKAVTAADDERRRMMEENWQKTHVTTQDYVNSISTGIKTVLGTTIEKLIFNTGDLSHMWGNFAKQVAKDIASKAFTTWLGRAIKGASTGGGSFLFDLGSAILGGANGTSLTGVPGYAMGTPMSGVDTVPAMLSPGEIVLDRNASDVFRGMAANGGGMGGPTVIVVQSYPSLLGNKEELIRLDTALNNPSIRTSTDRRKV